ncbi:unnamed protein product, partial [Ixodes hexagonus]
MGFPDQPPCGTRGDPRPHPMEDGDPHHKSGSHPPADPNHVSVQLDPSPPPTPKHMRSAPIKILTHPVDRNLTWSFLASVAFVSLAAIVGLPVVLVLLSLLPVAVVLRHAGTSCASAREGVLCEDDKRFVSAIDTVWLHDSEFNFHIAHCVFFVEPGLTASLLGQLIAERILDKTNDEGKRIFRRFTRKVVPVVGGFTWVEDDRFRIEHHVLEDTRSVKDSQQLRHYLMALMSRGMNVNRPLWDVHVLPNFDKGRETVLVARVHQASTRTRVISDGVSLMMLFCNHLCDPGPGLRLKPRFGGSSFPLNVFRALVVGPLTFLVTWLMLTKRDSNYLKRSGKARARQRVIAWTGSIRMSQVHRIKQITRSTFNDVLMTAMSGSLRNFFKKRGIVNPPDIKVCLAVDLRYEPASGEPTPELGTQLAPALVRLPTNTEGAIPRLWEVRQSITHSTREAEHVIGHALFELLRRTFITFSSKFLEVWQRKPSAVLCNVPGPENHVVLGLSRVRSVVAWAGWSPDVPVAVTVTSYAGAFNVAVSSQVDVVPDPDEIVRDFATQLNHLSDLLSKRRIPGEHRRRSSYTAERRNQEIIKPPLHEVLTLFTSPLHQKGSRERFQPVLPLDANVVIIPRSGPLTRAAIRKSIGNELEKFASLEVAREIATHAFLCDAHSINLYSDDDLDGELRRPRRRALSVTVRRASLQALASTTRPLTT